MLMPEQRFTRIVFLSKIMSSSMMSVVPGNQFFGEGLEGCLVAVKMEQRGFMGVVSFSPPDPRSGIKDVRRNILHVSGLHHHGVIVK